jgi:hypothetical protein
VCVSTALLAMIVLLAVHSACTNPLAAACTTSPLQQVHRLRMSVMPTLAYIKQNTSMDAESSVKLNTEAVIPHLPSE